MISTTPIIELRDISYSYRNSKTEALKDVSLRIYAGEKVAFLGANGAGKSTLFRHLNGILKPNTGQILVHGEPISKKNISKVRQTVGIVFQNPDDQILAPTVEQDVAFGPVNMGLSEKEVDSRVREALELVSMTGLENRSPHHLSGGQKKRVAIAGILAMRPEVIVLDEPTAGLDPRGTENIMTVIEDMNRDLGITVILSTHDVDMVPLFADRVFLMHHGRIETQGTVKEIFKQPGLLEHVHLRMPRIAGVFELLRAEGLDVETMITPVEARDEILRLLNVYRNQ
ncbi:MAG: ATP-binding cassette domain-containing protein [Methanomethylovorans sp.]|uniref:energy-coupling factor ABC transporter ATP-binding protein n=1 Tax=Methanomethylovorans sp. TaxID=2758717 RepID=UPI000A7AC447|nr:ATP-binding cassette domain-containing protein [Methanomethylovorans sp.]